MVYVFLANGLEEIEALTPIDILRRAGVDVTTVAVGGSDSVIGSHKIQISADIPDSLYRDSKPDMIILPGGMPGASNLDNSNVVDAALKAANRTGAYICAICAAPMVLGKRGLLEGKNVTCYPGFEKYLYGAKLTDKSVVRDGNVITAKGMGVALDFSLELVTALCGKDKADELALSVMKNN